MPTRLMAMAAAAIFLLFPLRPAFAAMTSSEQNNAVSSIELPTAINEEAFFDDLPFQQQRQILREEVQQNSLTKPIPHIQPRQYNLLIR